MKTAILAAALAVGLAGHAALAQPAPPATLDDAGVMAWLKANIDTKGWTLIAADGSAVVLGSPKGVSRRADGGLTTEIRHEYYNALRFGDLVSRSNLQAWTVDCRNNRIQILSMEVFADNNLKGRSLRSAARPSEWVAIEPGSARARTAKRICDAPTTGTRLSKARPEADPGGFRFEDQASLEDMRGLVTRLFPGDVSREAVRTVFVAQGKATLKAHPRQASVEKYIYDIDLCGYYVWRWNISADYDAGGGLKQLYVNGEPTRGGAKPEPRPTKGPFYQLARGRPQAFKGEKSLAAIITDRDGDTKTSDDQHILTGVGPTRADPLNMGRAHPYAGEIWRSIFDPDEADAVVPYAGNCAVVDAEMARRAAEVAARAERRPGAAPP